MSSKSDYKSDTNQKARKYNAHQRSLKSDPKNAIAKNHVSENVRSKGGQPFHFAGPKKGA